MDASQDIRLNILKRIEQENRGTAEFIANEYLSTAHDDLGTIKRAVLDLLDDGYVRESNLSWPDQKSKSVVFNIDTTGGKPNKNSNRLNNKNDIKSVRLYITLKGKRFLIEEENLRRTTWWIKHDWWLRIIYIALGAGIGIGGSYLTYSPDTDKKEQRQEQATPSQQPSEPEMEADSTNTLVE